MKKVTIAFILGGIVFGSIGIYAASYLASDVSYSPTDNSWEVSNVNEALDSLYDINTSSNKGKLVSGVSTIPGYGGTITLEFDFEPNFVATQTDNGIDQYNRSNMWLGFWDNEYTNNDAYTITGIEVVNGDSYMRRTGTGTEYFKIEGNKVTIKNWDHGEKTVTWYVGAY